MRPDGTVVLAISRRVVSFGAFARLFRDTANQETEHAFAHFRLLHPELVIADAAALDAIVADLRLLAAAEMVGLGQRLLDDTLTYVKEREQFGVAIGSFQALQHRLVDCYAREEQARSMLYRAALTDRDDAAKWQRAAAGAKAFIGENVDAIAREAVQMHGGMGITDELAIGHALKRVLLLAWPLVLTNLSQFALTLTDTIFVGHLGTTELAAVTLGANLSDASELYNGAVYQEQQAKQKSDAAASEAAAAEQKALRLWR